MIGFWSKIVNNKSEEMLVTLFVVIVQLLKFLINSKATKLKFKKMIVSVPIEITFLIIGCLISKIVKLDSNSMILSLILLAVSMLIIIIQYALQEYLDDRLSGRISKLNTFYIISNYVVAIVWYIIVIWR